MKDLWALFTTGERATLAVLALSTVFGGFLEAFSAGAILPYVSILQEPRRIFETPLLNSAYETMQFDSERSFIIFLSVILLALFFGKALFSLWLTSFQYKFVQSKQASLGKALLARYLLQPYAFFLNTNAATLIANLTTSINQLCSGVIQSALLMAAEGAVATSLVILLIILSPGFSILVVAFIGLLTVAFLRVVKERIDRYASDYDLHWKAMIKAVNVAVGAVKEIKILGREDFFVDAYGRESVGYTTAYRRYSLLSQLPRVTLETSAVASLVVLAVVALLSGKSGKDLFPVLAVFAVATIRLVPSMNRILQAWNAIGFSRPAINIVVTGLHGHVAETRTTDESEVSVSPFTRNLLISVKSFTYPGNSKFIMDGIDLQIEKGETVAIIGHSGSGKSTLIDFMLGLLPANEGRVSLDGVVVTENAAARRRRIGYIPQTIYLSDDTILHNVAFGVPDPQIDRSAAERAIRLAGLEKVIQSQSKGLSTIVGDRGVRLSGGERQRIGIARALYHDPEILILDEATSALDNETERSIADAILQLSPAKTIIIVAHRLSTIEHCDKVYLMRDGRIIDQGSFADIRARHSEFVNPQSTRSAALRDSPDSS